eukprot:TRINITY_DN4910_c1_g1_i14.p4 TRINITY_DN4910_c1_g1~~TRINITY_DN4910_c1_g1_i14.p4  ORF type:complete len:129 (+),score=13.96 TRINITY_DN4910_c1_g1_i14:374-760(+)
MCQHAREVQLVNQLESKLVKIFCQFVRRLSVEENQGQGQGYLLRRIFRRQINQKLFFVYLQYKIQGQGYGQGQVCGQLLRITQHGKLGVGVLIMQTSYSINKQKIIFRSFTIQDLGVGCRGMVMVRVK